MKIQINNNKIPFKDRLELRVAKAYAAWHKAQSEMKEAIKRDAPRNQLEKLAFEVLITRQDLIGSYAARDAGNMFPPLT